MSFEIPGHRMVGEPVTRADGTVFAAGIRNNKEVGILIRFVDPPRTLTSLHSIATTDRIGRGDPHRAIDRIMPALYHLKKIDSGTVLMTVDSLE